MIAEGWLRIMFFQFPNFVFPVPITSKHWVRPEMPMFTVIGLNSIAVANFSHVLRWHLQSMLVIEFCILLHLDDDDMLAPSTQASQRIFEMLAYVDHTKSHMDILSQDTPSCNNRQFPACVVRLHNKREALSLHCVQRRR